MTSSKRESASGREGRRAGWQAGDTHLERSLADTVGSRRELDLYVLAIAARFDAFDA